MKVRTRSPLNLSAPEEGDAATQTETAQAEAKTGPLDPPRVSPRTRVNPTSVTFRSTRRTSEGNEASREEATRQEPAAKAEPAPARSKARPARDPAPQGISMAIPEIPSEAAPEAAPQVAAESVAPEPRPEAAAAAPTAEAAAPARPAKVKAHKPARFAYFIATLAAVVWAAGVAAFIIGYQGGFASFDYAPFNLAILGLVAIAPIGLIFAMAYVARQGSRLAVETTRARTLSDAMVAPTALASGETADVVRAMRAEIDEATASAARARDELNALREALAEQTKALNDAAEHAARTAKGLEQTLGKEREQMATLASALESQTDAIVEAVERQTRTTGEVSDLAQAQLREAEAALTARAADLAAAAGDAQDAARLAADDLARQTIRLETAGTGVAEQIRSVEEGLSQQRAALVAAGYTLRTDQEDFSAQVETQRAQLAEALSNTQTASAELTEASTRGAEALSGLVVDAAAQAKAFAELSATERDAFQDRIREALDRFTQLAAEAREDLTAETGQALVSLTTAADDARKAADAAADAAQARIDNLGEAAFDAARRADEAFEARLAAARKLFDESSSLIDEAGERAHQRMDANLGDVRATVTEIEAALAEIDDRSARLPGEARARISEIRASVEEGLEAMAAGARKAAEETKAVDAAFQERVKANYEMLAEAVKLMGLVSGGSPAPRPRPEPEAGRRREPAPAPRAQDEPQPTATGDLGLRPRLKLTPAAGEEDAAPATFGRRERDGWTWRDLLGSMEGGEAEVAEPVDDDLLADRLIEEIHRLGVDPNALLPRSRVEAAAEAHQVGAPDTAREIVRRVAPAAARRISRHLLTDKAVREQADRFLAIYETRLAEAVRRDPEGYMATALLASEPGRAFLLIDAAIGDLG